MKKVKSFNVQIWVGLKEGYDGIENPIDLVYNICNKYVNENIYCVFYRSLNLRMSLNCRNDIYTFRKTFTFSCKKIMFHRFSVCYNH